MLEKNPLVERAKARLRVKAFPKIASSRGFPSGIVSMPEREGRPGYRDRTRGRFEHSRGLESKSQDARETRSVSPVRKLRARSRGFKSDKKRASTRSAHSAWSAMNKSIEINWRILPSALPLRGNKFSSAASIALRRDSELKRDTCRCFAPFYYPLRSVTFIV